MTKFALTLAIATLTAVNAYADRVIAHDHDWTLAESSNGMCVAYAASIGNIRGERGTLQVVSKKGARNLLELMIRTDKKQSVHSGYRLQNDESTAANQFAAIDVTQDGATYW